MSGRPTDEIVADLRTKLAAGNSEIGWEAADRLEALVAELATMTALNRYHDNDATFPQNDAVVLTGLSNSSRPLPRVR